MDKHTAPQQGHQEPSKRKPKRSSKAKQSTPQLDSDVEEERHQLQEPTPPVASSSAYELSTIQPGTQPPSTAQPHTGADPEGGLQRQQAQRPRSPKPSSFQISKTLCAFGRYHHTRPEGLTTDAAGRLSLANIMQVWGIQNGLQSEDVVKAIQQHKARNSNHHASAAIGAPRPPKRRRFM